LSAHRKLIILISGDRSYLSNTLEKLQLREHIGTELQQNQRTLQIIKIMQLAFSIEVRNSINFKLSSPFYEKKNSTSATFVIAIP